PHPQHPADDLRGPTPADGTPRRSRCRAPPRRPPPPGPQPPAPLPAAAPRRPPDATAPAPARRAADRLPSDPAPQGHDPHTAPPPPDRGQPRREPALDHGGRGHELRRLFHAVRLRPRPPRRQPRRLVPQQSPVRPRDRAVHPRPRRPARAGPFGLRRRWRAGDVSPRRYVGRRPGDRLDAPPPSDRSRR